MSTPREPSDDAVSEQLARDLQMAYELQAQEEHHDAMQHQFASGTNSVASNTNILGGGMGGDRRRTSKRNGASPLSTAGNMFSSKPKNSLLDDGSSSAKLNGSLLYVPCEIRGRVAEMMVDSGSQTSVISSTMMHKLKLQKRLNTRYQGVAAGVGAAKILGRIENVAVTLGAGVEFNLFFLVIDVAHDMMILGVDQMRRFNCLIDLQKDVLVFGGQGGVEVPFLPPDPNHTDAREQCTVSTIQNQDSFDCESVKSKWSFSTVSTWFT